VSVAIRRGATQLVAFLSFWAAALLTNSEAITSQNSESWILAAALSALAPVIVLDAVWWINRKTREGRPLSTRESVVVSVVTATVFAVSELLITRSLGLESSTQPLVGFLITILAVSMIGIGLMVLMQARRLEDERRASLLEEGIALELARQEVSEIVQRMQMALHTDIDDALVSARTGLEERLKDQERALGQEHWPAIAQELRSAAQDTVRPLSRSLWSRTIMRESRLGLVGIIRNIVTQQPFRPLAVVVIYMLAASAESITILGWRVGLLSLAVGVALIAILLTVGNRAMQRHPRQHAMIFIATVFIVEITGLLSFPARALWGSTDYTWGEFIASVILGSVVIVASSALGSIRTHRDDIARTFQADINRELIESHATSRQVAQLARESARILHGAVQTRLIACAVVIERASDTQDVVAFRRALHEAHTVLTEPLVATSDDDLTLLGVVERKVSLWSSLCSVDISVDATIAEVRGRFARDVGRVVEEGLSNAIRHGGASHIRICVSTDANSVIVLVNDNGVGPSGGESGLGSSMLDSVSEKWSLSRGAEGTALRVALRSPSPAA
jgi:signal transduction histidine kinase